MPVRRATYEGTWERSGAVHRQVFQRWIEAKLLTRRVPHITLTGTIDNRLARVEQVLAGVDRFLPLGDMLLEVGTRRDADPNQEGMNQDGGYRAAKRDI